MVNLETTSSNTNKSLIQKIESEEDKKVKIRFLQRLSDLSTMDDDGSSFSYCPKGALGNY